MTAKNFTLTVDRLREVLDYDSETGVFIRTAATGSRAVIGAVAGSVAKIGYRYINIDGRKYLAQRLAWMFVHGEFPRGVVDHIDGNRSFNAIRNLRICSIRQNVSFQAMHRDNTTGYKGVHRKRSMWSAEITVNRKKVRLGVFRSPQDAAQAYDTAAISLLGEYAKTNKMLGLLT